MPLPLVLGIGAAIAGAAGVGTGIHGGMKMKEANDTMKAAESQHKKNIEKFENSSEITNKAMDTLGEMELQILKGFDEFSNTIEKIQNRPQFKQYNKDGVTLPKYDKETLKNVSVGAGVLLGGLGGAAVGTAGGFAAAGATTSAVMALGTASTGTAIASLSGVAATNATLAALGGGAIAAGGGGMALGTTILGATTLGVGLLVGGVIFSVTGSKLSDKADEAYSQMKQAEETINKACSYLASLKNTATEYTNALIYVREKYLGSFNYISYSVNQMNRTDWDDFTEQEKKAVENTVLLVGLLYKMCQVSLVSKAKNENQMNTINTEKVKESIQHSKEVLKSLNYSANEVSYRKDTSDLTNIKRQILEEVEQNHIINQFFGRIIIPKYINWTSYLSINYDYVDKENVSKLVNTGSDQMIYATLKTSKEKTLKVAVLINSKEEKATYYAVSASGEIAFEKII